jgi:hypothetical protein
MRMIDRCHGLLLLLRCNRTDEKRMARGDENERGWEGMKT